MKLQVIKNIQFSRLIKANGRLCEFNFRKLGGLQEGIFSVDVADDRGNRILFRMMKNKNDKYIIKGEDLPVWVTTSSDQLHEKIEEVMNLQSPAENEPSPIDK
jgi:hypothetical protein